MIRWKRVSHKVEFKMNDEFVEVVFAFEDFGICLN